MKQLISLMESANAGVFFERGLSDSEIAETEETFHFVFPQDLPVFLQLALPVGMFPNWRSDPKEELQSWIDRPLQGMLFDLKSNAFWLPQWGKRPEELHEAEAIVREKFAAAPTLIPIWGHRYMPAFPHTPGNPIYSVYQTDIVHYGFDLDDYFRHEFRISPRAEWPERVKAIDFWNASNFPTLEE